jgi:hypothetical protein
MKLGRWKYILFGALALHALWLSIRTSDLGALTDLTYDASSCCQTGATRTQVNNCFSSRSYDITAYAGTSEAIHPRLILGGWSRNLRSYSLRIDFTNTGKVQRYALESIAGFF